MTNNKIKRFNLDQITNEVLSELQKVFSKSYHNGHMYEDFLNDIKESPEIFQLFLAYQNDRITGVSVIETKPHKFIEYFNFPPVHIKRFTVLPEYRSQGIGKLLLDEAKKYSFEEQKLPIIFGESNELGALSFYGREGALYSRTVIEQYSRRNSPEENITFFKEFISNPTFRKYRYPEGNGILFVFCNSDKEKDFFESKSFISKNKLLNGD